MAGSRGSHFMYLEIFTVLCCLLCSVTCLYEDQVGKFDWFQKYVGKINFAVTDVSNDRILVATDKNVLASILLSTGEIEWRQILEKDDSTVHLAATSAWEVVTISNGPRRLVRNWDTRDGYLTSQWTLPTSLSSDCPIIIKDSNLYRIQVLPDVVSVDSWNTLGKHSTALEKALPWMQNSQNCVQASTFLVCATNDSIKSINFADEFSREQTLALKATSAKRTLTAVPGQAAFVLDTVLDNKIVERTLYLLSDKSPPKSAFGPVKESASIFLAQVKGSSKAKVLVQVIAVEEESKLHYSVSDENGKEIPSLSGSMQWNYSGRPTILHASCILNDRVPSSSADIVLGTTDHAVLQVKLPENRISWVREEALASITVAEMFDLPVSEKDAVIEKEFDNKEGSLLGMLGRRLLSQAHQIKSFAFSLLDVQELVQPQGERTDLVRDEFGLHKMIVAATSPGKLFGIDNLSGEIIWKRTISNVVSLAEKQLFVQRTTRHAPHPAQCTLLLQDEDTKNGVVFTFNPMTGLGSVVRLSYRVRQALLLPFPDAESLRGLILMDTKEKLHALEPSAHEGALSIASSLFMYVADVSTGQLVGYSLTHSTPQELVATRVWEVALGKQQQLIAVVPKSPLERVHSQGRVLADRSVLYKYVNPNLVAVITQAPDPIAKNVLNILLLDAVSGAVVFSLSHKKAREPVHVVHSENWLVYSYFSDKWRRTEITALELYEGKVQSNTTAFSSVTAPVQPMVERQSYILPAMVQAMKSTITEKGITSKHILVSLATGGVLEMPWLFLDPRRPLAATPEMREEGIIPYMPELPIPPESIVNYNRSLPRVAGIHTAPSGLESTCLLLVYGLDLFYTRVAPSKTFDVLKDDFDHFLISIVLAAFCIASYITRRLASRKALRQSWK